MVTRAQSAFADKAAELLSVGANPTRVLIVLFLQKVKSAYVQEIVAEISMSQSAISHQLRILEDAGIVASKKEGRDVRYTISKKPPAQRFLKALRALAR